jgi:succinoglycan biosynthesis transport protein ExoP
MPHTRHADLTEPEGPTLLDYLGWLRRRWWILLVGALIGLAGAAAFTAVQPRTYTSTTSVLVRAIGPDLNPTVKVNLDTEAQVVRSMVVANRAKALMNVPDSPQSLLEGVSVTVPPNSQVLIVSYEAGDPEKARNGSHAFTQAYLDLRVDVARREMDTQISALRQQITEVSNQLTVVAGRIAALPANSPDRQRAEADRSVLTNQLAALNGRLSPLLATQMDPGSIISDAALPTSPSSPNRLLNLASGFGAGLLLGIALALLLDRLDTRVRRGRDIAERLGVPVLLEIPQKVTAVTLLPPANRAARELARLRNVLLTLVPDRTAGARGRQLLVTAVTQGAAAGFVAGNLAAAYARTGAQVAVLVTNPKSPLARVLNDDAPLGLGAVLRRDVPVLHALVAVPSIPKLRFLLPGDLDADAELPMEQLLEIIGQLAARFDHVLIETAPPSVAVEAQALASHVDAVVLVAEARHTRRHEIAVAMQQFEQVDAPVIGAVLVGRVANEQRRRSGGKGSAQAPAAGPSTPVEEKAGADTARASTSTTGRGGSRPGAKPIKPGESTIVLPKLPDIAWKGLPGASNASNTGNGSVRGATPAQPAKGTAKPIQPVQSSTRAESGEESG